MKASTYETAVSYYLPAIKNEIKRCNNSIELLEDIIKEEGESEDLLIVLENYIKERNMWMEGLKV